MDRFIRRNHRDKGPYSDMWSIFSLNAFPFVFIAACMGGAKAGFGILTFLLAGLSILLGISAFLAVRGRFWGLRISGETLTYRTLWRKKFTPADIAAIRIARSVRYSMDSWKLDFPDIVDKEGNPLYSMILLKSYDPEQMNIPDPADQFFCRAFRRQFLARAVYDAEVIDYLKSLNPAIVVISSTVETHRTPAWTTPHPRPIPPEGLFVPRFRTPSYPLVILLAAIFAFCSLLVLDIPIAFLLFLLLSLPAIPLYYCYDKRNGLHFSPQRIYLRGFRTKTILPHEIKAIRISAEIIHHTRPSYDEPVLDKWGNQCYGMALLKEYDPMTMHSPDGNSGFYYFLADHKKDALAASVYDQSAIDYLLHLNPGIIVIPPDGGTPIFPTGGQQRGWIVNVTKREWDE